MKGTKPKPIIVRCVICGIDFTGVFGSRYCSEKCREVKKNNVNKDYEFSRFTVYNRDDFKCVYCGRSSIEDGIKLNLDHIIPYSTIKDNSIYNLITCCEDCNTGKASKILSYDVYYRIYTRNLTRNKQISNDSKELVNKILNTYFNKIKNKRK